MNCLPQRMKPNNLFALWDCKCKRYMHAPNDCILYRGEYENLDACPVCSALRYKIRKDDPGDVEGEPPRKRVPTKVMWYSPIIPRLKRLFRNKDNAKFVHLIYFCMVKITDMISKKNSYFVDLIT